MEPLRRALSQLLGEQLSRIEPISEGPGSSLWALYGSGGYAMPLLAKSYTSPGIAAQVACKISMLARSGIVRLPVVYGVLSHDGWAGPDILLMERLRGVSAAAPARTPQRREQLKDQIVEGLLSWHRLDSRGYVGSVDEAEEKSWPCWYQQRVEGLWNTLNQYHNTGLGMQDRRILFRSRQGLARMFEGFSDNCVLIHGNLTLSHMLKETRSDQLLAVLNPGTMLWAPREYEIFRLNEPGPEESLFWHYLRRAPLAESFLWRRWLYLLWDVVAQLLQTGCLNRPRFDRAARALLPWLS